MGKLPTPLGLSLEGVTVTIRSADAGQPRVSTEVRSKSFGELRTATLYSNLQQVSSVPNPNPNPNPGPDPDPDPSLVGTVTALPEQPLPEYT